MVVLEEAKEPCEVLLVHSPYPGRLKFQGVPSSLFAAAGPFVRHHGQGNVGYLDPTGPSREFYRLLSTLLASGEVRALCVSTSTAAVGETSRIAAIAAAVSPETLVVVGGPHEDAVTEKCAERLRGVHLSIAGEAEEVLAVLLESYLNQNGNAEDFVSLLTPQAVADSRPRGRFTIACRGWGTSVRFDHGPSAFSDPEPLVYPERYPSFDVFTTAETVPLMASRGCPYGRCTFCAEANRDGGVTFTVGCDWIEQLALRAPGAALYFQDSIFPLDEGASGDLLPLLARLGRPWGCQAYLPMLSERRVAELADHGCTYIYAGVESGSTRIVEGVGKHGATRELVLERMRWARDAEVSVGLSLMFGSMNTRGDLLETRATVQETLEMVSAVHGTGVRVAGLYPNIQTVLPGTALARGLAAVGCSLDFYAMPRTAEFDELEDGGVGYNFLNVKRPSSQRRALAEDIVSAVQALQATPGGLW